MFKIKTKIKKSSIHDMGLFADENISAGQEIYIIEESLDLLVPTNKFDILPKESREFISHYGYLDKNKNMYHLSYDNIRFCNHSKDANLTLKDKTLISKRDIENGEELTQDYREFETLRDELK